LGVLPQVRRPSRPAIAALVDRSVDEPFSYAEVGATSDAVLPAGYDHAEWSRVLGQGDDVFASARAAVAAWCMFDIPWVELHGADRPPTVGMCVAPVAHVLGLWSVNIARVIAVIDDGDRFGFAYGTLHEHAEQGEERFLVTRAPDGTVAYELRVFFRPQLWWARVGKPVVARQQRRFREASGDAMQRAVASSGLPPSAAATPSG
jgi:uncharacterized protein (UPF0548 family)